ncbi:MAG: metabolite traffic protein EboE [SAR324 cluster bacterium]|nr:metabolite traffic protein EboE [SAR324 cluster bacterium]
MKLPGDFHLTYCSNIHPGETWEEVRANLGTYLPQVRARLNLDGPFGVGLRLSAQAAETLEAPAVLAEFQQFLAAGNCYVFTINGFPYGVFHRARVKEEVYLPDWKDEERLRYSDRMARLLAALLPAEPGLEGSVSTVPGAFKEEVGSEDDVRLMAGMMLRHVATLHRLREETGKTITLALEPEPCCYLETVDEALAFFRDYLFAAPHLTGLAETLGVTGAQAEQIARRHIGLCYDACHMAVEFENMATSLAAISAAGIKICKFQISSALKLIFQQGDGRAEETLRPFVESTYLHQVVEKNGSALNRYTDLPEGLAGQERAAEGGAGAPVEWRVHFHVPIFLEEMKQFQTTQQQLLELIEQIKKQRLCPYLEVETYTWDVLPAEYKTLDLASAITRELDWVRERLAP